MEEDAVMSGAEACLGGVSRCIKLMGSESGTKDLVDDA